MCGQRCDERVRDRTDCEDAVEAVEEAAVSGKEEASIFDLCVYLCVILMLLRISPCVEWVGIRDFFSVETKMLMVG